MKLVNLIFNFHELHVSHSFKKENWVCIERNVLEERRPIVGKSEPKKERISLKSHANANGLNPGIGPNELP
jgi:hypothetical protein